MREIKYAKSSKDNFEQITDLLKKTGLNMENMIAGGFTVALHEDRVLGCARIIEMNDGNIELASVAVVEDQRKKGIGSKIVKNILAEEKRRPIYLMCRKSNQCFYEKLGFKKIEKSLLPAIYRKKVEFIKNKPEYQNIEGLTMVKY